MPRLLLASLIFAAACGSNAGRSANTTPSTTANPQDGGVCNDEVVSARGSTAPRCFTKRQLDDQKRFTNDVKLDPTPRQTYNN